MSAPLHISKCYELANYYFTFNGWNVKVLDIQLQHMKYRCSVELNLSQHSISVCGTGEDSLSEGKRINKTLFPGLTIAARYTTHVVVVWLSPTLYQTATLGKSLGTWLYQSCSATSYEAAVNYV